jgi:small subunit ribosomal protein S6
MPGTQAPKHLREYETIFLIKPDLTDDAVDKVRDRVRGIVDREGGKIIRFTVWGKKRTMYPIAKQPRAIYVHAHYLGRPGLVAEIERNLHNLDEVSRFISVKLADDVDPEARQTLEDVKMTGDADESRPTGPEREDFRSPEADELGPEMEDEAIEEA